MSETFRSSHLAEEDGLKTDKKPNNLFVQFPLEVCMKAGTMINDSKKKPTFTKFISSLSIGFDSGSLYKSTGRLNTGLTIDSDVVLVQASPFGQVITTRYFRPPYTLIYFILIIILFRPANLASFISRTLWEENSMDIYVQWALQYSTQLPIMRAEPSVWQSEINLNCSSGQTSGNTMVWTYSDLYWKPSMVTNS